MGCIFLMINKKLTMVNFERSLGRILVRCPIFQIHWLKPVLKSFSIEIFDAGQVTKVANHAKHVITYHDTEFRTLNMLEQS